MSLNNINVHACESVNEFQAMIELQRMVWSYSDLDVVPSHMFVVAAESGGQVLGAFLDGKPVGFTLAYAGEKKGKPYLHSHLAAVLPAYRDLGVGRLLKLEQRRLALERGIDRIEWTFDPLQSRNAYFNMCRLGAVCRRYLPNLYGITSSSLHGSLPTDRLLAEWHLDSPQVAEILAGQMPSRASLLQEIVEIPADRAEVEALQSSIRQKFTDLFDRGYLVTWFERGSERGCYLLEKSITAAVPDK